MGKFKKVFRGLRDPRAANASHELLEVLFIALAAMLCRAKCASDMAEFGRAKEELLRRFLRLQHGIPSHDTFSRVFCHLEPQAFEGAFRRFMAAFAKFNRAIENQLHWVLDVVFDEDQNRARKDHAPENLAILRRLALNLIRSHSAPISMRQKIERAGRNDSFLLGMLSHMQ